MIKENYEEYIVEFSVTIVSPTYSTLQSDPETPVYNEITRELTDKVRAKNSMSHPVSRCTVNFKMPPRLYVLPFCRHRNPFKTFALTLKLLNFLLRVKVAGVDTILVYYLTLFHTTAVSSPVTSPHQF